MQKINILLIEDDADDVMLLQEALHENSVDHTLSVIMEGDKALPYLEHVHTLPDVIVMDLNLPRLHGREILAQLNASPVFRNIPIMVLTTSTSREDVEYALALGARKFISKPNTIQGFDLTVEAIVSLALVH